MSLRTRLIIAFLLLSVVPLTAVTLLSYRASATAFERAAEREATDSARDVSRRMETVTADVGHRVDRLFVGDTSAPHPSQPDLERVRRSVTAMLGEAAPLVERVEFWAEPPEPPAPSTEATSGDRSPAEPDTPPRGAGLPRAPLPPRPAARKSVPPAPPPVMVLDVPAIVQQAAKAAAELKGLEGEQRRAEVERRLEQLAASTDALKTWTAVVQSTAEAKNQERKVAVAMEDRHVEIPVTRNGRVIGRANATLNMDRTLRTVLSLARRDQGEIPFAIDRKGALYGASGTEKQRLQAIGVEQLAPRAASGKPQRAGEWIVVSRKDPSGVTFGIARPVGESLREIRRASMRNLSLGLLVIGLAFIGIIPVSHRMTQHLSTLTGGVRQLARGDFRTRVPVRTSDEFGTLASAFNQMAQDLERHQALVVEQERLRRELELSRLIQMEMLPRFPLHAGPAEIAGVSVPAQEVGGDFFNYFVLPDARLALLVGDVSGKGVGAALLMANVQATLRARLPHEMDLAALADRLDRELDANTPGAVYVTLFLAILEADGRTLRYVNAGHNPQFVVRANGEVEAMSSTGLPIALYSGHGYRENTVPVNAGDLIFFYTDGLVEAENEQGDMFGAERLQQLLAGEHTRSVAEILQAVEGHVSAFRGKAEALDDATMMALRIEAQGT